MNRSISRGKGNKCRMMMMLLLFLVLCAFISIGMANEYIYAKSDDNYHLMGSVQKKDDAGYGKDCEIKDSDVHYGWNLGQFYISGFTRKTVDESGECVFLKNVGDTISLSFRLEQDIEKLNDNEDLHISEDTNGYDEYFGIMKDQRTNFGYGTLLIKKIDEHNEITYVPPYINYLKGVEKGADTDVKFLEEGDYEIALDYEIQENKFHLGGWRPFDGYTHYQIFIKFKVRNGNCMVFPKEIETNTELVNTSFTEKGFYLDLTNSKYLTIDVKKQVYLETEGNLVEDTRFNRPAADKEEFTDEGVYIITVRNIYTNEKTEKKIYVGDNPLLKAHVTTGKDIAYIKELIKEGAVIEKDGTITLVSNDVVEEIEDTEDFENTEELETNAGDTGDSENSELQETNTTDDKGNGMIIGIIVFVVAVIIGLLFFYKDNWKNRMGKSEENK